MSLFINIVFINKLISNDIHDNLLKKLDASFPAEIFFTQTDSKNTIAKGTFSDQTSQP